MNDDDDPEDDTDGDDGEPEIPDAADPRQFQRRETRAKLERREADAFWRGILADPVGRREMWGILREAHTFETRFGCGPNGFPNPQATFHHLGERDFGQRLHQTLLCLDPVLVAQMHAEHDPRFAKPKRKRET